VVVGTTDGALEAELTHAGRMLVQGLALSDEAAAKARQHLFAQKLYGLASVARVETARTLPYYDRIVNLLVADLDALGSDAPSKEEIQRVLGYEGVAYLKKDGRWSKTVKPTPKDVDNWGHYMYDASRNSVSKDLLVGPPNAVRWLGGPTGRNPIGGPRTSDGVFVQISNPYARPLRKSQGANTVPWAPVDGVALWAKDVNSGVLLWNRVLSRLPVAGAGSTRWTSYAVDFAETFVAAGGRVYVYDFTNEDQVALTALNLRSGAVQRVFDQSVVFRKADAPTPPPDPKGRTPDWRTTAHRAFADTTVLVHEGKVVQALWDKVFVMDVASGDVIWKKETPAGSNIAKVLISGDRLILILVEPIKERFYGGLMAPYVAVEAWQLRDGKPAWRFADLKGWALCEDARRCHGFGSRDHHLLLPVEPVEKQSGKHRLLWLLDTRDGSLVWEKPVGMDMWTWAIIGDQIWSCRGSTGGVSDLATGRNLFALGMPNTGNCSVGGGTPNYFIQKKVFFPIAQAGSRDLGRCPFYYMRSITQTCGENLCPSYGSVYNMPPVCRCENALSGTQAWYALAPTTAVPDGARLLRHAAEPLGAVERQTETLKFPGAFDWGVPAILQGQGVFWRWTARGGEGRSIWLGYGLAQTPPVQAGDLTLVAYVQEHRLAATRGGKEVWNFVAGGRIGSPPVVHEGLAIFGCHDGYVYAVNLKDGSLAWRFLAAPADRRHVVMNQVESVWPVYGVVLHEGRLYFSAGKHAELDGGVHFYCLDPRGGKMQWHVKYRCGLTSHNDPPRSTAERNKRIINDVVEVHDGKVWLFEMPVVDLANPKDTIINPETLAPLQLRTGTAAGATPQ
jgi:outer membrane protein assembly factor BamB